MSKCIYKLVTTLCLIFISILANAQKKPPGPPNKIPIDGGISLLFAAGAAYGVRKLYISRNQKEANEQES